MNKEYLNETQRIKKVLILYDTVFGNTKKVAMSITRGLEAGGLYVDSLSIYEFDIDDLKNYDVVGIGGPTHMHGVSKSMKQFLSKLKHLKLEKTQGFAFETKTGLRVSGSAAKRILRYLKKMKICVQYPLISCDVIGKEGPLEENCLIKAEKAGLEIAEKLNKICNLKK